jgi:hypothetical protein
MGDDYLSSLAARALGTRSVVQPRLASRFEPRPVGSVEGWNVRTFERSNVGAEASGPADGNVPLSKSMGQLSAQRVASEDPMPDSSPQHMEMSLRAGQAPERRSSETLAGQSFTAFRPGSRARDDHEIASAHTPGLAMTPQRLFAGQEPQRAEGPAEVSSPAGENVTPLLRSGQVLSRSAGRLSAWRGVSEEPLRPKELAEASSLSSSVAGGNEPTRRSAVVRVRARRAPGDLADAGSGATEVATTNTEREPVIHVTIGRVEVRAVTAQAPVQPQRKPSPVMTLEEYLQRRTGRANS